MVEIFNHFSFPMVEIFEISLSLVRIIIISLVGYADSFRKLYELFFFRIYCYWSFSSSSIFWNVCKKSSTNWNKKNISLKFFFLEKISGPSNLKGKFSWTKKMNFFLHVSKHGTSFATKKKLATSGEWGREVEGAHFNNQYYLLHINLHKLRNLFWIKPHLQCCNYNQYLLWTNKIRAFALANHTLVWLCITH